MSELNSSDEPIFTPRMQANDPNRLNLLRTVLLSLGFLSVLSALTYYNFEVPLLLFKLIPDDFTWLGIFSQNTLVGTIMVIDNVLAVMLQPYFGSLSDRTKSKFGRRMPYIIIGTFVCGLMFTIAPWIQIMPFEWIQILAGLVAILFVFNLFMAFFRTPSLSLLADYTPDTVRSAGSAIQQFVSNLGTIIAFLIPTLVAFLQPLLNLDEIWLDTLGFLIISVFMFVCLALLYLTIKETPTGTKFFEIADQPINIHPIKFEIIPPTEEQLVRKESNWANLIGIFKETEKSTLWLLLAVFCWFTGFGVIEAFFSQFAVEYLFLTKAEAGQVILVYPISMILSAIPTGIIGQKIGRKNSLYLGVGGLIILMTIISFIIVPSKNVLLLIIFLGLVGFFWMDVIVNTFPMVWSLAPEGKVGGYTGVYYTFNQMAAIISPILMGAVFDIVGVGMGPNRFIFMFPYVLTFLVVALLLLTQVVRGEVILTRQQIEEQILKYEEKD
ncbi:MAG: MFS transporter [Candidatus Hermodarchaeota archaeon]